MDSPSGSPGCTVSSLSHPVNVPFYPPGPSSMVPLLNAAHLQCSVSSDPWTRSGSQTRKADM